MAFKEGALDYLESLPVEELEKVIFHYNKLDGYETDDELYRLSLLEEQVYARQYLWIENHGSQELKKAYEDLDRSYYQLYVQERMDADNLPYTTINRATIKTTGFCPTKRLADICEKDFATPALITKGGRLFEAAIKHYLGELVVRII